MNRRLARRQLATIDMTPLMDLTFMLLIIFIITVPAMYYKTDVQLTPPESTTNDKMTADEKSVFVELDKDGRIWLGTANAPHSQSVPSIGELTRILTEKKNTVPDIVVFLVGDKSRRYEEVIDIANAIQHSGIDTMSLVFNPEELRK
ncbi:MAG: biopolymer transporter ExbD [Victivallales bacterium]|nr:biopolymer transporter ExbD [Victivallales bacterium]